jgi:hypothetical protein
VIDLADPGCYSLSPGLLGALAERALGYSVDVEELFVINKKLESCIVRKYYPPDVTACIFWLKNRQPERWRDVQRNEAHVTSLKSSDELRQALLVEFKDLVDQGLLQLPPPDDHEMIEINPKANDHKLRS